MTVSNGNLYKFMALFGLLLFLSCVLLPYMKLEDNVKGMNDVRRNLVVLNHERDALVNEIKRIEATKMVHDSTMVEANLWGSKILEIKNGIDLRTEQISLENEILEGQLIRYDKTKEYVFYALIVSVLITLAGFILWYFKIQLPSNRIMRMKFVNEASKSDD